MIYTKVRSECPYQNVSDLKISFGLPPLHKSPVLSGPGRDRDMGLEKRAAPNQVVSRDEDVYKCEQ